MRQTLCRYAIWYGDDMRIKCTMCIFDLILPAMLPLPSPSVSQSLFFIVQEVLFLYLDKYCREH